MVTLTGGAVPATGSCTVTVPVTAVQGTYLNKIQSGALLTSNGSNRVVAEAILVVTK
jgi:hypothetical protein